MNYVTSVLMVIFNNELMIALLPVIGTVLGGIIGFISSQNTNKTNTEIEEKKILSENQREFVNDLQEELSRMREETSELRQSVIDLQRSNVELIFENKKLQSIIEELMGENKELKQTVEKLMDALNKHKGDGV